MVNVLFVCLGNICRSPMAEALFRDLLKKEGLAEEVNVDSAATAPWHVGKAPHKGTLTILQTYGVSTEGLICREIAEADLDQFDYIIGMDDSNMENIKKLTNDINGTNIYKMMDFTEEFKGKEVPDPYFTGDFQETYDLLTAACEALLLKIKREHRLG